jgi:hypothetical protein
MITPDASTLGALSFNVSQFGSSTLTCLCLQAALPTAASIRRDSTPDSDPQLSRCFAPEQQQQHSRLAAVRTGTVPVASFRFIVMPHDNVTVDDLNGCK